LKFLPVRTAVKPASPFTGSAAFTRPLRRGMRCVPPSPGKMFRRISGNPNVDFSVATIARHPSASS
jgi:hypothetical protein